VTSGLKTYHGSHELKAEFVARMTERRCGTCEHYNAYVGDSFSGEGTCAWRPQNGLPMVWDYPESTAVTADTYAASCPTWKEKK
jgi:hypothetical protein